MAHKFTVLLKRPEWCADRSSCVDVVLCLVEVEEINAQLAVQEAKRQMWEQDNDTPEEPEGSPEDYHCVAAFVGWQSSCYGD